MNPKLIWRLAWKEYRSQRDLFIAVAAIAIVLDLLLIAVASFEHAAFPTGQVFYIAVLLPLFYMLGAASLAFAGEHENETFGFLTALPQTSSPIYWAKTLIVLLASLALAALLLLASTVICFGNPLQSNDNYFFVVGMHALALAELWVWGTFYSLRMKSVLWSIAACGLTALACVVVLLVITGSLFPGPDEFQIASSIARIIAVVIVFAINVRRGEIWLGPPAQRTSSSSDQATSNFVVRHSERDVRFRTMRNLAWQTVAQSWPIMLMAYCVVAIFPLLFPALESNLLRACAPALFGSLVFFVDQTLSRYRFFAERGVAARTVWLTRMLTWLVVCLPIVVIVAAMSQIRTPAQAGPPLQDTSVWNIHLPGDLPWLVLVQFSLGALGSLSQRAGLLGLTMGIGLNVGLMIWIRLMRSLGVPDAISIYPLPLVFLGLAWLRAPNWLVDRDSWRNWLGFQISVASAALLYLTLIAAYRVYEIPYAQNAITLTPIADGGRQIVDRSALEVNAKLAKARELQNEGKLSEALDEYIVLLRWANELRDGSYSDCALAIEQQRIVLQLMIDWARAPNQTAKNIRNAMERIESTPPEAFDVNSVFQTEYARPTRLIALDERAWDGMWTNDLFSEYRLLQLLPWERIRSRRILEFSAANRSPSSKQLDDLHKWQRNSLLGSQLSILRDSETRQLIAEQKLLRAETMLRLALLVYRAEHEKFPDSLSELPESDQKYTIVPILNRPFVYRPNGFTDPKILQYTNRPQVPFIWTFLRGESFAEFQSLYSKHLAGDDESGYLLDDGGGRYYFLDEEPDPASLNGTGTGVMGGAAGSAPQEVSPTTP